MADPFSLLGTVVSMVSFGIQLYGGLTSYADAIYDRKPELAPVRMQTELLRTLATAIRTRISAAQTQSLTTADTLVVVDTAVRACYAELRQPDALLVKLRADGRPPQADLKGKVKEVVGRLSFSFQRDKLVKLSESLRKVDGLLQVVLQMLSLWVDVATSLSTDVTQIQDRTEEIVQHAQDTKDDVSQVHDRTKELLLHASATETSLNQLSNQTTAIEAGLLAISSRLSSIEQTTFRTEKGMKLERHRPVIHFEC